MNLQPCIQLMEFAHDVANDADEVRHTHQLRFIEGLSSSKRSLIVDQLERTFNGFKERYAVMAYRFNL